MALSFTLTGFGLRFSELDFTLDPPSSANFESLANFSKNPAMGGVLLAQTFRKRSGVGLYTPHTRFLSFFAVRDDKKDNFFRSENFLLFSPRQLKFYLPHMSHENGFSPVCVSLCLDKVPLS